MDLADVLRGFLHESWNRRIWQISQTLTFPKAKIVDTNEIPESQYFLTKDVFCRFINCSYSHHPTSIQEVSKEIFS